MYSNGKSKILKKKGYTKDIIDAVKYVYDQNYKQGDQFKGWFVGRNVKETCNNIIDFVLDFITYKVDPSGVQWVKTPNRFIDDACGDCKSYSIFVCSVLTCLGITNGFRFASYKRGSDFTHVYSWVIDEYGNKIIIDCVAIQQGKANRFEEVDFYKIKDIMNSTKISILSGLEDGKISFSANDTVAQITAKCFLYASVNSKNMRNTGEFLVWITNTYKSKKQLEICAYVFQMFFSGDAGLETMKMYCKEYVNGVNNPNSPYQISKISTIRKNLLDWFNDNITDNYNITYSIDCADVANDIINYAELGLYLLVDDKYLNIKQVLKKQNEKVFFESIAQNSGINFASVKMLIYGAIESKYGMTPNQLLSIMFDGKDFGSSTTSFLAGDIAWNPYEGTIFDANKTNTTTNTTTKTETKKTAWDKVSDIAKQVGGIFTNLFGIVKGGTNNIAPTVYDVETSSSSLFVIAVVGLCVLGGVVFFNKKKGKK